MYKAKFPIHIMASETGRLEDISKKGDKDALAIFYDEGCYRSVSYTHLDVYKRQGYTYTTCNGQTHTPER